MCQREVLDLGSAHGMTTVGGMYSHCIVLPYALGCWLRHSPRAHSMQTLWLLPHGRVRGSVKSIKQTFSSMVLL